jgi:25S rRNA (uracil2843-N3)-methyltransferase
MAPSSRADKPRHNKTHGKDNNNSSRRKVRGANDDGNKTSSKTIPLEMQQLLLDIFEGVFSARFNDSLPALIHEVKQHLYNRDFANAFGKEASLEAYAMRWSPCRALAYADLLNSSQKILAAPTAKTVGADRKFPSPQWAPKIQFEEHGLVAETDGVRKLKVVCIGGGAGAELLAFAGLLSCASAASDSNLAGKAFDSMGPGVGFDITAVDIADWSRVLGLLYTGITTAPEVSKYASRVNQDTRRALVDPSNLRMSFLKQDVLKTDVLKSGPLLQDCDLVTVMFTLNELYSTSMSATTDLLLTMTHLLEPGSLLLVVDSPGSYSSVSVGKDSGDGEAAAQRKYPMQWLLNHTLLEAAATASSERDEKDQQWEKVEECESRWFRLPDGLKYPIDLEDMRYQYHLYRRI